MYGWLSLLKPNAQRVLRGVKVNPATWVASPILVERLLQRILVTRYSAGAPQCSPTYAVTVASLHLRLAGWPRHHHRLSHNQQCDGSNTKYKNNRCTSTKARALSCHSADRNPTRRKQRKSEIERGTPSFRIELRKSERKRFVRNGLQLRRTNFPATWVAIIGFGVRRFKY